MIKPVVASNSGVFFNSETKPMLVVFLKISVVTLCFIDYVFFIESILNIIFYKS